MKKLRALVLVPAVLFAVACGRDDSTKSVDAALDSDLRLAGEAYAPGMDSISMMERNAALAPTTPTVTRTAPRRTTTAPRRTTTTRRASSSGGGTYSAPVTVRTETQRNTARDAAIGATAGAVIGATTSRDKVKGGLIGAAIGGIAGAVIGHNVDKKTVPVSNP
ncbi:MAG: glycine zipper domain-containing protein [Gemmatimonadaceae bacterium]